MENITIKQSGITLEINMCELHDSLSHEQRMTLAKDLCWDEVMEEAKARLAGNSECWAGDDKEKTFEFLRDQMIDEALKIKFGAFDRVRQKIQDHLFDSRLYWSLIHSRHQIVDGIEVGTWFREWSRQNGFEDSNYCDETSDRLANEVIKKFEEILREEVKNVDS